jgi:hypothetical protein
MARISSLAVLFLFLGTSAIAAAPDKTKEPAKPQEKAIAKPHDDEIMADDPADQPANEKKPAEGTAVPKSGPKVLLVAFQPIFRSVAPNRIQTANDLLQKELDQKDTFIVIRGGISKEAVKETAPGDPKVGTDALRKLWESADKAEANREIRKAIELRKKTIEELEKQAATIEPDDFVMAHHFLARALMWAGDDKEATEVLDAAARMHPGLALEAKEFSRLYRRWFQKASEKALAEKPGDLLVQSALPGAAIALDGRAMDVTPVLLKKVVAGKHLISAKLEGVPPFGAVVDVKSQKKNEFMVSFSNTMGGSAVGVVADALAQNSIPKKAVESAAQAGKDAGAEYVVLGALAKGEDKFHVHPFVVDVKSARIQPLEVVDFDLDLLTTESDVLRIVLGVAQTVAGFKSNDKEVAVIEKRIKAQNTINEVAAAPSLDGERSGKREPAGVGKKRAVYQPLKGGTIKIKDEEQD